MDASAPAVQIHVEGSTISSYIDYEERAKEIVRTVIEQSIKTLQQHEEVAKKQDVDEPKTPPDVGVAWITGEEFTVYKGAEVIEQLIQSWVIGKSWKHCTKYLEYKNDLHLYSAKFSEPTRRKPVPQATASVYFYLSTQTKNSPVLAMFVVEGQRTPLLTRDTIFHEEWLRNVVRNKLSIVEAAHLTQRH